MKFSDVWNGKKYSVLLALQFDNISGKQSGVYQVFKEDLEMMAEQNPSYFRTVSLPELCARLDKMGADVCTDVVSMIKRTIKDRKPLCELDAMLL